MVDPHGNGIVHPLSNWLVCMQIEKTIIEEKITPMLKLRALRPNRSKCLDD